jgi:N-acyl-D-aspartate/D-glutamate deacylase
MMVGSDGIPELRGKPHPRLFGTFPRVLGEYVRRRRVLGLEEAVRRMTSVPAETFGLTDRGRIEAGRHADLVLFDPGEILDLATYDEPKREPQGVAMVIVNGQIAFRGGAQTDARAGQALRYRRTPYTPT